MLLRNSNHCSPLSRVQNSWQSCSREYFYTPRFHPHHHFLSVGAFGHHVFSPTLSVPRPSLISLLSIVLLQVVFDLCLTLWLSGVQPNAEKQLSLSCSLLSVPTSSTFVISCSLCCWYLPSRPLSLLLVSPHHLLHTLPHHFAVLLIPFLSTCPYSSL